MPQRFTAQRLPLDASPEEIARAQTLEGRRVQDAMNRAGGVQGASRYITADSFLSTTDGYLYADTTAGPIVVVLLLTSECVGMVFGFKRTAGANTFTISRRGASDVILNTTGASSTSITVTTPRRLHAAKNGTWEEV